MHDSDEFEGLVTGFFGLASEMLWVLDENGSIVATNAEKALGYEPGELTGKSVLEAHPPEVRDTALRVVHAMLEGTEQCCRLPLVTKQGKRIPVVTRVAWGRWRGKKAILGTSGDLSSLMLAQDKFEKAFHESPAVMAISDIADGKFIEVNRAFLETIGYSRDDVIGRTARDINLYDHDVERAAVVAKTLAEGDTFVGEVPTRIRDGRILDGEYRAKVINVGDDRWLFTTMIDRTEGNRNARLRRRETEFKDLLLRTQTLLNVSSLDEMETVLMDMLCKIGPVSGAGRTWLVLKKAEDAFFSMVDQCRDPDDGHAFDGSPPQIIELSEDTAAELARGNTVEYRTGRDPQKWEEGLGLADPDGPSRVLLVPISHGGILKGFMGFTDIGEDEPWHDMMKSFLRMLGENIAAVLVRWDSVLRSRLAASQSGLMAEEAREEAARKDRFLAEMSHEIRNNLGAITAFAKIGLGNPEHDPDTKRKIALVSRSSDNILHLVNEVLEYSRLAARQVKIESTDFQVRPFVEDTLEPSRLAASAKGVGFWISFSPSVPKTLRGDAMRFGRILANLAGNAVKFTEAGSISVSAGVGIMGSDAVELKVVMSDTGIGMSREQVAGLFTPYAQADSTISRRFGGTGLGLVITKQLCELFGGNISVESEAGKGSTFTVTVPFELAGKPPA